MSGYPGNRQSTSVKESIETTHNLPLTLNTIAGFRAVARGSRMRLTLFLTIQGAL